MGRVNAIWKCERTSPMETLDMIQEEWNGDGGEYTRVTLENFDRMWENQDRWESSRLDLKEKLKGQVAAGQKIYWFTVHY